MSFEAFTAVMIQVVFWIVIPCSYDDDRNGLRNVGSVSTPDAADSPRRLHQIQSPRKLKNLHPS